MGNGFGAILRLALSEPIEYSAHPGNDARIAMQLICRDRQQIMDAYADYLKGQPAADPPLVAMSFSAVTSFSFDGVEMARLGQKSENEWVGANTGSMDQLVSANGISGHALFIDCRDLAIEAIPLPEGTAIVVMDTMTLMILVPNKLD